MIIGIKADSPTHRRFIQFEALKLGVLADVTGDTTLDLTVDEPMRALNVIRRAGGEVTGQTYKKQLTKAERFVS